MLKKSFLSFIFSFAVLILMCNFSLAQSDVDVDLTTGGSAKCTFSGKVPFRSIKAADNNLVVDAANATTNVSITSELDTDKSTLNANILATVEATSNPLELLNGKEVTFQSDVFEFSISKTNKSSGKTTKVTNETPDGERTSVTGSILVKSFDSENNDVSGILKMTFANTLRTIQKLEEDIGTDENGKVTVLCKFEKVPVNFSGSPDLTGIGL